jgi:spore germination protein
MRRFVVTFGIALVTILVPVAASAATSFEVSGWLPYWRGATSTNDVIPHLSELTEVDPFVYSLRNDGTFLDNAPMTAAPWVALVAAAKAAKVRVIPTIMTSNGSLVHTLLSNSTTRIALEQRIADFVNTNGFDGIDIDFEGKLAEDKANFATFLKGLYARMGQKWVVCDIEARTPLDARYYGTEIPPDATIYANDFVAINKYCDRVRLMTYDQQGIDQQLAAQAASSSQLYAPVADPVWVEKVVALAAQQISKSKLVIGVPTYGYEYKVTAYAQSQYTYDILWTFNPGYALPLAAQYGVLPDRNTAGEMYFTYTPTATPSAPISGASALLAANAASLYATTYASHLSFNLVDWPDAASIAQKVALAKQLGIRGIAIFKLDGGEDPNIWNVLQGVAGTSASTAATQPPASASSSSAGSALVRDLDIGSTGTDVRTLQVILNSSADTQVAGSGAGSPGNETTMFGLATAGAVQKFQVKYGIAKQGDAGYGHVGPATRAKLNQILASL